MTCFAEVEPKAYRTDMVKGRVVSTPMPVEDWLKRLGMEGDDNEQEQALHRCPPLVRAAMAAHLRWWFLARSHSAVVRTFAHAVMAALWWNNSVGTQGLQVWHMRPRERAQVACLRGTHKMRAHRMLPYRVLHFFGNYLAQQKAVGVEASSMRPKEWPDYIRCNPTLGVSSRDYDCENIPCVAVYCDHLDYDAALNYGGLVRSTKGRMDAFAGAVEAAMQPFLGVEFSTGTSKGDLLAPVTLVVRPRSKTTKSMIPRHLAYGMEQLAEELPLAMQWIERRSDYRNMVLEEADAYREHREGHAMQAMAARDSVSDWLHHYDTVAAIQWAMPTMDERRVSMCRNIYNEPTFAHNVTLEFPGITKNRCE